jgi:hypothetical protein
MVVVTGVFVGIEENPLYRLDDEVLAEADRLVLEPGSVLALPHPAKWGPDGKPPTWTTAQGPPDVGRACPGCSALT